MNDILSPSNLFVTLSNLKHVSFRQCSIKGRLLPSLSTTTTTLVNQGTKLTYLDLSENDVGTGSLGGTFPTEIGSLNRLEYLNLSYNRFSDTIPTEIGKLSLLTSLLLNDNNCRFQDHALKLYLKIQPRIFTPANIAPFTVPETFETPILFR